MDSMKRYFELLRRVDALSDRLTALHAESIACRPGCASCCLNLSVFPVEFFSIKYAMEQADIHPEAEFFDTSATCGFLRESLCLIYPYRPIICRTHGLPILFLDDSSGNGRWEVSFCELNFKGQGPIEFTNDALLDIEGINSELSRINRDFQNSTGWEKGRTFSRIPLRELCINSGGRNSIRAIPATES